MVPRAPISLAPAERELLLALLPASHCDDTDCPLESPLAALISTTRDRLEGKSLEATLSTNFGRDTHESALGSTVTSVQLSTQEVDLLRAKIAASDKPLRDSLAAKLELLRNALEPASAAAGQSLADVAASVGLSAGEAPPSVVPLTVLTGCLGAGKTTAIRSLLRQLPAGYTCAWLKNEYGDAGVDRQVAQDARVAIKEIVNGCLCCTKVGELADALRALHELRPHRIIVEASGSALPGPLVWEIEKAGDIVRVDGVVTVVDCANFGRMSNFSRTAKIQAKCVDLVLLNKVELAGEPLIEQALDDLNELVPEAPKVRTRGEHAAVEPGIIFGLDAALWRSSAAASEALRKASEEEAAHMAADADCYQLLPRAVPSGWSATRARLEALMRAASRDELYRSKGIVPLTFAEAAAEAARQGLPPQAEEGATALGDTWWLFNGVAGRLTLERLSACAGPTSMVFMGEGLKLVVPDIEEALGLPPGSVTSAGTLSEPRPTLKVPGFERRVVTCGVARGLSAPE